MELPLATQAIHYFIGGVFCCFKDVRGESREMADFHEENRHR